MDYGFKVLAYHGCGYCPFCGGTNVQLTTAAGVRGHCGICGASGPPADTQARAIELWNRRHMPVHKQNLELRVPEDENGFMP